MKLAVAAATVILLVLPAATAVLLLLLPAALTAAEVMFNAPVLKGFLCGVFIVDHCCS